MAKFKSVFLIGIGLAISLTGGQLIHDTHDSLLEPSVNIETSNLILDIKNTSRVNNAVKIIETDHYSTFNERKPAITMSCRGMTKAAYGLDEFWKDKTHIFLFNWLYA